MLQLIRVTFLLCVVCCTMAHAQTGTVPTPKVRADADTYVVRLMKNLKSNMHFHDTWPENTNIAVEYNLYLHPSGEVLQVKLVSSSGAPAFDQAVKNAILKSSPFPKKDDGSVDPQIHITYRLKE